MHTFFVEETEIGLKLTVSVVESQDRGRPGDVYLTMVGKGFVSTVSLGRVPAMVFANRLGKAIGAAIAKAPATDEELREAGILVGASGADEERSL